MKNTEILFPMCDGPIGVFDSGYGGLSILHHLHKRLPQHSFLYLGDNARAPYGNRSFETVYEYTLECVQYLFKQGCPIVILACNTASAKALRTIQQKDLPKIAPDRRVLGVIRPTAEIAGKFTQNGHLGLLATSGTISSQSYQIEIQKFFPDTQLHGIACPMWVPLIENNEHLQEGADYFVALYLQQLFKEAPETDSIILGCTHYPLILPKIKDYLQKNNKQVKVIEQGPIIAESLADYLIRHPELANHCLKGEKAEINFLTTDDASVFSQRGIHFFGQAIEARQIHL